MGHENGGWMNDDQRSATRAAARFCEDCSFWVPYNSVHAGRGECTLPMAEDAPIKVTIVADPESHDLSAVLLTPFDWSCNGWSPKHEQSTNTSTEDRQTA